MTNLLLDVVERIGGVDGEADQNNVGIGIGKRSKTVVIFLTSSIPKGELDVLAIDLNIGDIVLENGGDIDLRDKSLVVARMTMCMFDDVDRSERDREWIIHYGDTR